MKSKGKPLKILSIHSERFGQHSLTNRHGEELEQAKQSNFDNLADIWGGGPWGPDVNLSLGPVKKKTVQP